MKGTNHISRVASDFYFITMEFTKSVNLSEETRKGTLNVHGELYDEHIKDNVAYIVEYGNEKNICAVMSLQFYNFLVHGVKK